MISKIITRKKLSDQLIKLEISTSETFGQTNPGQYIILRNLSDQTSVALPIFKNEPTRETLTLLAFADATETLDLLNSFQEGHSVELEGPLGQPFRMKEFGSVLCIANYESIIPLLPVVQSLRMAGNKITCILTQNPGTNPIIESEIRKNADHWVATGENQRHPTQLMEQTLRVSRFDQVIAIGNTKTIRETSIICTSTRTPVQSMLFLNKLNYQGKAGIFMVNVCCKSHAICVDGHNFNAHYLHFEDIAKRFECHSTGVGGYHKQLTT